LGVSMPDPALVPVRGLGRKVVSNGAGVTPQAPS
jgi:hypothetical protein